MRTHADATHNTEAGSGRTRTSGARRLKVGLAAMAVFMATFAGLTATGVTPAGASTLDGTATIANPNGNTALSSGDSTTQFTVTLPAQAACDGDSASDGYHVYSYLVPEGTNPAAISFTTGVPVDYPDAPSGLLTTSGRYYGGANTASNTGQIISIPNDLEFAPLVTKNLIPLSTLLDNAASSGVWEAGIACATAAGAVTDYWNTEVTFTASGSDPNGFVWSATPGPCAAADSTPGFYSGTSATFTQQTTNWFAAASTGCPTPTITETGSLPNGVTLATSGLLTGSPTQPGSYPIVLSAAVSGGTPATQNFTLTVPNGVPYPPTGVSASGATNAASVSFTPPTNNGGANITSYKVTATDTTDSAGSTTATGTTSPISATKLFGGDTYTFTVAAINSVGTGTSSASSSPVTLAAGPPATPVAPSVTAGNQSATLTWGAPYSDGAAINGYVITPYLSGVAQTPVDVPASSTYTFDAANGDALVNGDSYTFTVAATNSVGTGSASAASSAVVPDNVPDAPATPTASAGNQTATVNWAAPYNEGSTITGYVVTPYDNGTAGTPLTVGNVLTYTFSGLNNGDSYTFTVAAINGVGTGSPSAQSAAVVPDTVPDTPAAPIATAGNTQASITWSAPFNEGSTITGYVLTEYDSATEVIQVTVGNVLTYTFSELTNDDSYTYTVAAINGVGTGGTSAASNAVEPGSYADAPPSATATVGDATATVNWTASSDEGPPVTGYVVTPYDNGTAGTPVDVGNVLTYTFDGLNNGDSYYFTVGATNSVGTGIATQSNTVIPDTEPGSATGVTATAGLAEASVSFTAAPVNGGSPITSYTVTAIDSTTPANGGQSGSGSGTTVEVTGLTPGDSYTFTVTASNDAQTGPASSASNAVTPYTEPGAPTAVVATAGNARATVSFTGPESDGYSTVTSYTVTAVDSTTPGNGGQIATGTGSPVVVTGLTPGNSYTFTVTATNGPGSTGPASSASNSVKPYTVPGAPTAVTVTAGKASVKITWKAPTSNGGSAITHYIIKPSTGSSVTVGDVTSYTVTKLTNGTAYTFTVSAENAGGAGKASAKSKSVTPDGLYIVTKSLPKATKGKKYTSTTLTSKYGVGKLAWTATGLPAGLKLSTAGVLSGTETGAAKTYAVTVTVKDSSKPTKQTATAKFSLVVAS